MRSMRITLMWVVAVMLVVAVAQVARADWDPNTADPRLATNHKMHYPQMPDASPLGLDVDATDLHGFFVADDWRCSQTGPVTDIHIWGSWLNDIVGNEHGWVGFHLFVHGDIPATANPLGPYSMPSQPIWEGFFGPELYQYREYMPAEERFIDPRLGQPIGIDHMIYQYNFKIDPAVAFEQKEGQIYWLSVQAIVDAADNPVFGWKTSLDHFNDDAVWGDGQGVPPGMWSELRYPSWHQLAGQSMDMAFVITPEPATLALVGLGVAGLVARRRRK
jgi:hypothetical protein